MAKNSKKGKKVVKNSSRRNNRLKEEEELAKLQERIDNYDPKTDEANISQFSDLPITENTLKGLKRVHICIVD